MTDQRPDQPGDMGASSVPPPPPPQAAPPAPAPSAGVGSPADLGTRFLARLIDSIAIGIVTSIIAVPFAFGSAFSAYGSFRFGASSLLWAVITAAITIGYFAFMEANMGQTLGKMALGLRTEGPSGGKPTMEQALKRNAWYALAIVPFIGWLAQLAAAVYIAVTINNSPTRTGWHDAFAGGTKVVKAK